MRVHYERIGKWMESQKTQRVIHIYKTPRRSQRNIQRRIFRTIFSGKLELTYITYMNIFLLCLFAHQPGN